MSGTVFLCCDDRRRAALQETPALNGIDFLEVADLLPADLDPIESALFAALPVAERDRLLWQRKLTVFFVNPLTAAHVTALTPRRSRSLAASGPGRTSPSPSCEDGIVDNAARGAATA
jgi:hypothetical protein